MKNIFSGHAMDNPEMSRYAVYFSDGQRFEVIAITKEDAKASAISQYDEWGHCTRVVVLDFEEVWHRRTLRYDKIKNLLFP